MTKSSLFGITKDSGSGPLLLTRKTVYILPNRDGFLYATLVMTMLVGSLNYGNSMALALTFLLVGLGLVAMIHTYRNLVGIVARAGRVEPVFAGQDAAFQICFSETADRVRPALILQAGNGPIVETHLSHEQCVILPQPAPQRGRLPLARVRISTIYPLGLFRAWSVMRFDISCLVYPAPAAPLRALPPSQEDNGSAGAMRVGRGVDDFAGFRGYQPGDPLRRLHWRAFARERGLHTTIFSGWTHQELWLDWDILNGLGTEERLSQLCRWILEADTSGLQYGLRLPHQEIPLGHGDKQRHRCLEALALYSG